MVNPRTVNAGIIIPVTGADVGTWGDVDVNPNMVAIDGFLCGVQAIALTNVPVTLTSPALFTPTPGPGPTQSQNRMLRLTGTLTADVTVTLPLPGAYLIDNQTVQASHVLVVRGAIATEVVALPPGEVCEVFNDGARVKFCNMGRLGSLDFWAGIPAPPSWLGSCTVFPFLICDGTVRPISQFPQLGGQLGNSFGGDGISTFGVPDLRGRYPLAYDGTGARVTIAGSGINGQLLGASQDAQTVTLTTAQIPGHTHPAVVTDPGHFHTTTINSSLPGQTGGGGLALNTGTSPANTGTSATGISVAVNANSGGGGAHNNMPNTQVAGIWVIKT